MRTAEELCLVGSWSFAGLGHPEPAADFASGWPCLGPEALSASLKANICLPINFPPSTLAESRQSLPPPPSLPAFEVGGWQLWG